MKTYLRKYAIKPRHPVMRRAVLPVIAIMASAAATAAARTPEKRQDFKVGDPEAVVLTTKDGIKLQCTWYPGTDEKTTIPVILLHNWDSNRTEVADLAGWLQKSKGHAVIVPDLRGHGESTTAANGEPMPHIDRWRPEQISTLIEDIETCKRFLRDKNNEGKLNIDLLTVIAEGVLCIHSVDWTIRDWSFGPLGGVKQGQDVKALIMISPDRSFRGLNISNGLRNRLFSGEGTPLSVLVAADEEDAARMRDARNVYDTMKRGRSSDESETDLFLVKYQTRQNTRVATQDGSPLQEKLAAFIQLRVADKQENYRWQDRSQ